MFRYRFVLALALATIAGVGLYSAAFRTADAQSRGTRATAVVEERLDAPTRRTQNVSVSESTVKITEISEEYHVDLAALNISPISGGFPESNNSRSTEGSAMGAGGAFLGVTTPIVNQNTANAFATISTGWNLGESVSYKVNGTEIGPFIASTTLGRIAVGHNTGAGFGIITLELRGLTSGKRVGGVTQVAATGPYLPGMAVAPHAVNTSAGGTITLYGWGYPASTSIPLYRDGVFIGNAPTDTRGRYLITYTPANNGNTSALYSSNTGAAGSAAGVSVEERSDAGTPPVGDQNLARGFSDRPGVNSTTGGSISIVGEGFIPGESVAISVCDVSVVTADANGSIYSNEVILASAPFVDMCVATGQSGRVARISFGADTTVANIRGMIVAPSFVRPGGTVAVLAHGISAGNSTVLLDGVVQSTTVPTDADGNAIFMLTKPTTGYLHTVEWVSSNGDRQSAVLLLAAVTAAGASVSGRVLASADGRGVTNARVTITGPDGASQTAITGRNGRFAFEGVETGKTYIVSVGSRRYSFEPQRVDLADNISGLTFTPSQ